MDRSSEETALKRVVAKTPGQIMTIKKVAAHLTILLPIVSHRYILTRSDLDDNRHLVNIPNNDNESTNVVATSAAPGSSTHGSSTGSIAVGGAAVTSKLLRIKSQLKHVA